MTVWGTMQYAQICKHFPRMKERSQNSPKGKRKSEIFRIELEYLNPEISWVNEKSARIREEVNEVVVNI